MKETRIAQIKEYLKDELAKNKNKIKIEQVNIENYVITEINTPNAKNLWHRIKQSKKIKEYIRFIKNDMTIRCSKQMILLNKIL